MSLGEALDIVQEVRGSLQRARGECASVVKAKLQAVLDKNKELKILQSLSAVLEGKEQHGKALSAYSADELAYFKFARVTSCNVERTFLQYKAVLTDTRMSFTFQKRKNGCGDILQCRIAEYMWGAIFNKKCTFEFLQSVFMDYFAAQSAHGIL